VAIAAVAAGLLAAPAAQATEIAAGQDPANEAIEPGRDITAAALAYDRETGTIRGGVALRGAPTDTTRAFVSLFAATRTGEACDGYPQIGLSSFTTDSLARWTRFDAPGPPIAQGNAPKAGGDGQLQKFEVTDPALAGAAVTCITAVVADPGDPNVVYDSVGPFAFEARPELAAKLGTSSRPLSPGKARTVRLTLRNPGDAPTGPIKLSIGAARGLSAKASRTVVSLRAGQQRSVPITVRLNARARDTTPLGVTVAAGDLRVKTRATLYLLNKPKGGGDTSGSNVCVGYAPVFGGVGEIVTYPC
jgi:hypothetical protein